jgi:hypothetical protein
MTIFDPNAFVMNISLNFLHLLKNGAKIIFAIHHVGAVTIQQGKKGIGPQRKTIYVLSFKAMTITTSYCFFIHMNVKEFKPKIHLIKFLI